MIKIILLSDIHLENKSEDAAAFVLQSINDKIIDVHNQGNTPVVVLAGDIHNGIKAYDWMSQIKAQVVYVAGNHEYWNGDFYEINEALMNKSPPNVEYLYNRALIIEDNIFLGSSLWTDVGQHTNPDIADHCLFVMNDVSYIKAKKWYKNAENIKALEALTSRSDEFIDKEKWNILIEREENQKTQNFYKAFNAIHSFFTQYLDSYKSHLSYSLSTTYEPITQSDYDDKMSRANNLTGTLKSYLKNNNNFEKKYGNDGFPLELLSDNPFLEKLFQQFKHTDFKKYNIVVVSHHLPFMEEILVGNHRAMVDHNGSHLPKPFNKVDENIFLISKGQNYPGHNYFWRCSKGEFNKEEDITKVAHYCNSGSDMFSHSFVEKVNLWLHGHEHHYNFIDYVKGVKIATNPMGYALYSMKFENGIPINETLSDTPEEKEKWKNYIQKIKSQFIQEVNINPKSSRDDFSYSQAEVWSWYLWDRDEYISYIKDTIYLNKKLSALLTKKVQGQKYDQFQINTYTAALNARIDELENKQKELMKAISIRVDVDYSFKAYAFQTLRTRKNHSILSFVGSHGATRLEPYFLQEEFELSFGDREPRRNNYGLKETFLNSAYLTYAQKKVENINELLNTLDLSSPQDVTQSHIVDFNKVTQKLGFEASYEMKEKIEKRMYAFLEKVQKQEVKKTKNLNF